MKSLKLKLLCGAIYWIVLSVLYLPILIVGFYAFFPVVKGSTMWDAPTLGFFRSLLVNQSVIEALQTTIAVAGASTAISLLAASVYAVALRGVPASVRLVAEALIYAPFVLPPIVVGISLLLGSAALDIPRGMPTIIFAHALFTLGIVYRLLSIRLGQMPTSHMEASADLGASAWQTLRFVVLPHLGTTYAACSALSLLLSFDETLITALVAGNATTLPLRLWAMMRVGFSPEINALVVLVIGACVMLALCAAALLAGRLGTTAQARTVE